MTGSRSTSGGKGEPVAARDVLRPNARTRRAFAGRILGRFERAGANSWDPYTYREGDGGPIDVFPGLRVQVEPQGARFRMRAKGTVVIVEWVPAEGSDIAPGDLRERFLADCVERFASARGKGVLGHVAGLLRR